MAVPKNDRVVLDDTDRAILQELQRDASLSTAELARRVGLSPSPCWRRVRRLEDEGVILRRVAVIDPRKVGLDLTAFALVSLDRHAGAGIEGFHEAVRSAPEVISCYAVTGTVDFLLTVVVRDMEAYERFLTTRLFALPMIRSINTSFVLRSIKTSTLVPV